MSRPKHFYLQLDTETCGDLDNPFIYDLGMAVIDRQGNIYETYNFVIYDVYVGMKELMKTAFYADKLPQYEEDLKNGVRKMVRWRTAFYTIRKLLKKYPIRAVIAHNARFDDGATKNTQRWLTKSKYRNFLPYGTEVWDTMKMALDVVAKTPTYKRFCEENGFMTKHKTPRPQVKAEVLYKYITGNLDFTESHTGLEDVLIEKEILAYCFSKHQKMRKELYAKG